MSIEYILLKYDISEQDEITFADSDLFNLAPFAKNLCFMFDSLSPLTIIIDGGWGTGKTVFAKQLDNMLGNRSRYINAFAHDYQDDVFTALLLSVKQAVKPKGEFKESFTNALLHHIAPNITNELIKKMTGGIVNIEQLTKEATQAYIENVENRRHMLDNFRNELQQHMGQEERPVVILVDELDRCKPKYALQVLEIIKHLYSVPNLHFVLIMNAKQIIKTIRHEHGCNAEEAKIYLQKFYDLMVSLPSTGYSLNNNATISKDNIKKYIGLKFDEMVKELRKYSPKLIDKWEESEIYFKLGFTDLAHNQNLSLREIDKIFLHISIMVCSRQNFLHIYLIASLLLIQLRESALFKRILNYYKSYEKGDEPDWTMNKDIYKFLSINSIIDGNAQEEWNRILDRVWSTDMLNSYKHARPHHSLWLAEHANYLTFLNSFTAPPEE